MALEPTLKMAIVDISLMHLLRTKKQSAKRTARKIIELCKNLYPDMQAISENDEAYLTLIHLIDEKDFTKIHDWVIDQHHISSPN